MAPLRWRAPERGTAMSILRCRATRGVIEQPISQLCLLGALFATAVGLVPIRIGVVSGRSMEPTLHSGQPFLFRRRNSRSTALQRGEVVLLRMEGSLCVKRVFAVERDPVWLCFQRVEHPGAPIAVLARNASVREWRQRFPCVSFQRATVPAGQVFVLGDGTLSVDSRQLGSIAESEVVGEVLFPQPRPAAANRASVWERPPPRPVRARSTASWAGSLVAR